jgi:Flp pilus assembly protein TadG
MAMTLRTLRRKVGCASGQSLLEFALVVPMVLAAALGVIELGYALLDQHVITKLAREGSNLTSRNTPLGDAAAALRTMSTRPVNFDNGTSKMILSVIKKGATTGTSNYNQDILYQRYEYGTLAATSTLTTRGGGSFGAAPEYTAANSDSNTNLQITNLPAGLVAANGYVYVTEIFTTHTLITPFDRLGIQVPRMLYSIAYF